jgi:hypothetical protein
MGQLGDEAGQPMPAAGIRAIMELIVITWQERGDAAVRVHRR